MLYNVSLEIMFDLGDTANFTALIKTRALLGLHPKKAQGRQILVGGLSNLFQDLVSFYFFILPPLVVVLILQASPTISTGVAFV